MTTKKRILFVGEASFLNTGFSNIYRSLLPRLVKTGKYEIAELGSYADANHPDIQNFIAGRWKFYPGLPTSQEEHQEFNKLAQSSHPRDKNGNIAQFCYWNFDKVLCDFKPDQLILIRDNWMDTAALRSPLRDFIKILWMPTVDSPCCVAGTPIVCDGDIKNIEDIKIGDRVLTHDGTYQQVLNTFINPNKEDIYEFKVNGCSIPIKLTANHPVLVVKYKGQKWTSDNRIHRSFNHKYNDFEVKRADEIVSGDYLIAPKPTQQEDIDILDLAQFVDYDKSYYIDEQHIYARSTSQKLNRFIPLNDDVLGFFGLYVAEGSCTEKGVVSIAMHKFLETEYLQFASRILKTYFNCESSEINHLDNPNCGELVTNTVLLSNIIGNMFGRGSHNKKIPSCIFNLPNYKLIPFLEKMFVGDGSDTNSPHNKRVINYSSVSRTLSLQTFYLLIKIGCLSSLSSSLNGHSMKYTINVLNKHGQRLADLFDWKNEKFDFSKFHNSKSWLDEVTGHALLRVRSVKKAELVDKVYNFEVENNNTYTAGFTVHNCQDELWIDDYEKCNLVMGYSDFGIHTLKSQSAKMKIFPKPMRPGVDLDIFYPMDKSKIREKYNLSKDIRIIGLCMRNQSRKLILDTIDAFSLMKLRNKDNDLIRKSILLLHTSWPDNMHSFDYPRHIKRLQQDKWMKYHNPGIMFDVLQTLICHNCGQSSVIHAANLYGKPVQQANINGKRIMGILMPCVYCGQQTATCPNTGVGFTREQMAEMYNLMDIMVQCSIAEGDGMPSTECKACGIPVIVTDHSATAEKGRFPAEYVHFKELGITEDNYTVHKGGITHKVAGYRHEPETHCLRAVPDIVDLSEKMKLLITDDKLRAKMSSEARFCAEENYDWDKIAKQWEFIFDSIKPLDRSKTWDSAIEILEPISQKPMPENLTDEQYVEFLYLQILKYEKVDFANSPMWVNHLKQGISRQQLMDQFVQIANQQSDPTRQRNLLRQKYSSNKIEQEWI